MEEAKAQKTEEQKKAEVNGGCLSTTIGLITVAIAGYVIYTVGKVQGWW